MTMLRAAAGDATFGFRSGFVTVLGRPNVGKSTLVNRAVGRKVAIVTDKPQTTRSRILGICHRPSAQIVFVDTPGVHKPQHRLNRRMIELSFAEVSRNDVNLVMIDASDGLGKGDRFVIERATAVSRPICLCLNKIDLVPKTSLLPLIDEASRIRDFDGIVPVSALTGENVGALIELLEATLPEGPRLFPDDMTTDQPERTIVAELIREQVVSRTRDEIPFATAVTVEGWEEKASPEGSVTVIGAVIWVERDSQKGIVIGRGGDMIKEVGRRARSQIEPLLGRHVYLDLEVKVREGWRDDPRFLELLFPS